jgi:hypothetical protein
LAVEVSDGKIRKTVPIFFHRLILAFCLETVGRSFLSIIARGFFPRNLGENTCCSFRLQASSEESFLRNGPMGIKWQENGYEVVITADGSPSLRSLSIPTLESMHHSGGALSETESIYTPVFRQVLDLIPQARFFSLGLGLGYNEWIWARECLLSGYGSAETAQGAGSAAIPSRRSRLVTVESQDFLSQTFLKHLRSQEFSQEHQDLLQRICDKPSFQESCKKDNLPTNVEESPREIQEKTLPQQLNQFFK